MEANNRIMVSCADRQRVGQVCAPRFGRSAPPEPYKGKGIRYEKEFVRRKIGKTGSSKQRNRLEAGRKDKQAPAARRTSASGSSAPPRGRA